MTNFGELFRDRIVSAWVADGILEPVARSVSASRPESSATKLMKRLGVMTASTTILIGAVMMTKSLTVPARVSSTLAAREAKVSLPGSTAALPKNDATVTPELVAFAVKLQLAGIEKNSKALANLLETAHRNVGRLSSLEIATYLRTSYSSKHLADAQWTNLFNAARSRLLELGDVPDHRLRGLM